MPSLDSAESLNPGNPPAGSFHAYFADALRFWETRRITYNLALLAVTAYWLLASWPHFRPALTLHSLPPLAILAGLANVCYSAAYFVDLPFQLSASGSSWRRRRWALWLAGTLFAILLASYWINDEIYPDFH
jgi:hypothetical protein